MIAFAVVSTFVAAFTVAAGIATVIHIGVNASLDAEGDVKDLYKYLPRHYNAPSQKWLYPLYERLYNLSYRYYKRKTLLTKDERAAAYTAWKEGK